MNAQNEFATPEQFARQESGPDAAGSPVKSKKTFVEPEISVPVDVLEATTFFNTSTSGLP